jgi:hypothetical protein
MLFTMALSPSGPQHLHILDGSEGMEHMGDHHLIISLLRRLFMKTARNAPWLDVFFPGYRWKVS